jgi:hypothetical protein
VYKFTMEKYDDPTGLVYLRARQYDPDLGRFVSADPVLEGGMRYQARIDWGEVHGFGWTSRIVLEKYAGKVRTFVRHLAFDYR